MRHSLAGSRKGFTLVELLVVIAIIGLLVAILLPSLTRARESALAAGSGSNLSAFGRGFMLRSAEDKKGQMTSSAFDHLRDGDVRRLGWVADILKLKISNPGKALDPSNRHTVNEKVADYMGAASTGSYNSTRWAVAPYLAKKADGTAVSSLADTQGATFFGTAAQQAEVWDDGHNSNYATTWHFSRGDVVGTTADSYSPSGDTSDPSKCPRDGDGPLSTQHLSNASVSSDRIALMGAARAGDGSDSTVTSAYAAAMNTFAGRQIIQAGDFTVESFTDGPAATLPTSLGGVTNEKIHEINDIFPVHGARKTDVTDGSTSATLQTGGYANILFADGHVAKVEDTNGFGGGPDGWLGPYKTNPAALTSSAFTIDANAWTEVQDALWLKRIRARATAGGGSAEG